jgi:hypothetical protein
VLQVELSVLLNWLNDHQIIFASRMLDDRWDMSYANRHQSVGPVAAIVKYKATINAHDI